MMKQINGPDFEAEVLQSDMTVVVDIFATWCGPCKQIAPMLDQLADEISSQAKIVKLDVDQNKELAKQYDVKSVPTLLIFKNGEVADRIVGALPKDEMKARFLA